MPQLPLFTLNQRRQVVVIDVETTGLNPGVDRIVEVAALRFVDGELVDEFTSLVDPRCPIPPKASAIHLIGDDHVIGRPIFSEIADSLRTFVGGSTIVAHNAAYDSAFLPLFQHHDWICTNRLARHLWPNLPGYGNQELRFWHGLTHPRLLLGAAHRSFADALATGLIFEVAVEHFILGRHDDPTMLDLIEYAASPIAVEAFPCGPFAGTPFDAVDTSYLCWALEDATKSASEQKLRLDDDTVAAVLAEMSRRNAGPFCAPGPTW